MARATDALMHLRRPHTQREDGTTELLLAAGLALLIAPLQPKARPRSAIPPTLAWPSRQRVVDRYNRMTGLRQTKSVHEQRWEFVDHFHLDLLAWALHRAHGDQHAKLAELLTDAAAAGRPLTELIDRVAHRDIQLRLSDPSFRLQLMTAAMASGHVEMSELLRRMYGQATAMWVGTYDQVLERRGQKVHDWASTKDLAVLLSAVEEGLVMRFEAASDTDAAARDVAEACRLMVIATRAIIGALVEPHKSPGPIGNG